MRDALAPVGMPLDPGVEGGLGLFEHGEVAEAGCFRGALSQLARDGIEGGGNGDQHFLLVERVFGMLLVPGGAQMLQVFGGGIDGRNAVQAFGGFPGQHGGGAVNRRVRQPALGRRNEAARNFRPAPLRELADDVLRLGVPGQSNGTGGKIALAGDVEERGQQGLARRPHSR